MGVFSHLAVACDLRLLFLFLCFSVCFFQFFFVVVSYPALSQNVKEKTNQRVGLLDAAGSRKIQSL